MRARIGGLVAVVAVVAVVLVGCSDDDVPSQDMTIARGQYLVEHVSACADCHTPRNISGQLDRSRWLAGVPDFADLDPMNDMVGAIGTPNLTPDSTGLLTWTDAEIKEAFLNGVDADGGALFPIMPYWVYHNMQPDDADAVVAYLRSVPAQRNAIPPRQPLGFPFTMPAQPIPVDSIPHTTLPGTSPDYLQAVRGRYLAGMAGVCIDCHTAEAAAAVPVDLNALFAGGRPFGPGVFSANITPHATGIAHLSVAEIRTILKQGVDDMGMAICPPMPVGPNGAFGGLTDLDANAIAAYIRSIRPLANTVPDCVP